MIEVCTCCNGCSSIKQLLRYPRYSFPKKLLVAISIVVIITMCIMPAEARAMDRRRHKKDNMPQPTKETTTGSEHRRRHHRRVESLQPTKETRRQPKNAQADLYNREMKKILQKIRNTRSYLKDDRKKLKKLVEYRDTMPNWLPTVNFVEIHFHDYKSSRSRKNGASIAERKFIHLIPKLYKSLVEYEEIFKFLLNAELNFPDDPYNSYKTTRKEIIENTLHKIYSTIRDVNDSMTAVNITVPAFNKKLDLSTLEKTVDYTQCSKNDYLAIRGYANLLTNWTLEFKCPRNALKPSDICKKHESKLAKRNNRRPNEKKVKTLPRLLKSRATT